MNYTTEDIASVLKTARENKGFSQRELSRKAGVPQGHISRIEKGTVDLRLSSLIALARTLDLEMTLVPRKTLAAVQAILRSTEHPASKGNEDSRLARKELERLQNDLAGLPAATLAPELAQIQRQVRNLQHFTLSRADLDSIRAARQTLRGFLSERGNIQALRNSLSALRHLRNALAHSTAHASPTEAVRPAYSLEDNDA
jgi:transcriptional regulator with XRE-family HTH domain